jgi:hypothetical protein
MTGPVRAWEDIPSGERRDLHICLRQAVDLAGMASERLQPSAMVGLAPEGFATDKIGKMPIRARSKAAGSGSNGA